MTKSNTHAPRPQPPRTLPEILKRWHESGQPKSPLYYRLADEMLKQSAPKQAGTK